MKVRYGSILLSDGAIQGASGFSLNGQQVNEAAGWYRAISETFFSRGNRSAVLSFSCGRINNTLHASERLVLQHFWDLPEKDDLFIWIGTDDDGEWVKFAGAVIDQTGSSYIGASAMFQYTFSVGRPIFDEIPSDVPDPDDTMKRATEDLDDGQESIDITFSTPFSSTPHVPKPGIQKPEDGDNIEAWVIASSITTTGFTAVFSGPIPGAGYKFTWEAFP